MKKTVFLFFLLFALLLAGCGHTEYTPETLEVETAIPSAQSADPIVPIQPLPESGDLTRPVQPNFLEVLEDLKNAGYTKENPLTDPGSMTALLTALEELQHSNFDQTGWYHMTCGEEEIIWLHFSEPGTHVFDQSLWLRDFPLYPNINVASILLKDGTYGTTRFTDYSMSDYKFVPLYSPDKNIIGWEEYVRPEDSHLKNLDWFTLNMHFGNYEVAKRRLRGENGLPNALYPEKEYMRFEYKAWTDIFEGQEVLAVRELTDFLKPCLINPITNEIVDYTVDTFYFSLKDGRILYKLDEGADIKGTVFDPYDLYPPCPGPITHYDQLPTEIQALYDEAEARLRKFIAEGGYDENR
ncbi:MAG: hypothetical protein ACOYKD_04855 [Anaerolineaceae bacterium]